MTTPIVDFVRAYAASETVRFHMPGHKGKGPLDIEAMDITEVQGADALYEAEGIIAQSEANATALFGSRRTLYSTEGSSQCIRAMLYLALTARSTRTKPVVVAARNVHKAFVHACALLDLEVVWLWPEQSGSLCACPVTADGLARTLDALDSPPCAVYLTSPDYLGGMADIAALAEVCHERGTVLAVDNAHGAYLKFLSPSRHPLDLGADICCDSAHKTLPVLTGGAYLHISKTAPAEFAHHAKQAMALFGSTSPSYLTLASLDACNATLSQKYPAFLASYTERIRTYKKSLERSGWQVEESDPLRITLRAPDGMTGRELADLLRAKRMECEYADDDFLVLMLTLSNDPWDLERMCQALGKNTRPSAGRTALPVPRGKRAMSIREALFSPHELIPAEDALGRVCAAPTVACPPAIPISVSGEVIDENALALFRHYGVERLDVVCGT